MMTRFLPVAAIAAVLLAACGADQKAADPVRPVLTVTVAPGLPRRATSTQARCVRGWKPISPSASAARSPHASSMPARA